MSEIDYLVLDAIENVRKELRRAVEKHRPMHSYLEGWAVIHEEYRKLETEVMKQNPDKEKMFSEALQVAAMGLRFLIDLCPSVLIARRGPVLYSCGCRLDCGPTCALHVGAARITKTGAGA